MPFDIAGARQAGYSDDEIADFLTSQGGDFDFAGARQAGYSASEVLDFMGTAEKPVESRNAFAVANDTVIEVANAAAGGIGAAANFISPGNRFSKGVDAFIKSGEESQSDVTKAAKAKFREEVDAADGAGGELAAVGRHIVDNPLLSAAHAAGSFVVPGGAIKGAQGAARLAGAGAKAITGAGLAAGSATGAALAGGDAAGNAYALVMQAPIEVLMQSDEARALRDQGLPDDQIREELATTAARGASVIPAIIGAAGGVMGAESAFAGKQMAGGAAARTAKTGLIEASQEAVEEGVTQYSGSRAAAQYDPSIDPSKGVAAAAGMGAALGGITGAGASILSGQRQPTVEDIGNAETVDDAIAAANAVVSAPVDISPESVASAEIDALEQSAGMVTPEAESIAEPEIAPEIAAAQQEVAEPELTDIIQRGMTRDEIFAQREVELQAQEEAAREQGLAQLAEAGRDQQVEQAEAITQAQGFDAAEPTAMQLAMQAAQERRKLAMTPVSKRGQTSVQLQETTTGGQNEFGRAEESVPRVDPQLQGGGIATANSGASRGVGGIAQPAAVITQANVQPNQGTRSVVGPESTQTYAGSGYAGRAASDIPQPNSVQLDTQESAGQVAPKLTGIKAEVAKLKALKAERDAAKSQETVVDRYLGRYGKGMSEMNAKTEMRLRTKRQPAIEWRTEPRPDLGYDRFEVVGYQKAPQVERRTNLARRVAVAEMSPDEMRQALLTSELTGLGNKRAYNEVAKKPFQASVDIDSLKWINDNLGHEAGDQLIQAVGGAMREEIADAYHLSGDEFAAQFDNEAAGHEAIARVRERLKGATFTYTAPDGTVTTKQGAELSYGIADTYAAADNKLKADKAEREARGERAGRGAEPAGVVRKPAAGRETEGDTAAEEVAPRQSRAPAGAGQSSGDSINVDGVERSRTNSEGKPIAASDDALRNFWRWFGDSKVVDDQGRPLVVYHGTRRTFNTFTPSKPRGAIGNPVGIYFDTLKEVAEEYAQDVDGATDERSRIVVAYVRVTGDGDGIIKPRFERGRSDMEIVALNPTQIKSIDNIGTFNPSEPSILKSESAQRQSRGLTAAEVTKSVTRLRAKWIGFTKVNTVQSVADLPANITERFKPDAQTEGFYDPQTKSVYLIADNIASPERAAFVASHEVVGHGGLRMLRDKSVNEALNLAGANRYIRDLAAAIKSERADISEQIAIEEAIAETAAAVETDDFKAIKDRYGVAVPSNIKVQQSLISRVIAAVKRFMAVVTGKSIADVSDADVRSLIDAQREAVSTADIDRQSVDQAEAAPALASTADGSALQKLAQYDEIFRVPKSDKDTVEGITADVDPSIQVKKLTNIPGETRYNFTLSDGRTARMMVRRFNPYGNSIYGFDFNDGERSNEVDVRPGRNTEEADGKDDVWIDVSLLEEGSGYGATIYSIAANYAHNTGKIFIGDPAGLSDEALIRRPEQMLSSALKFGTTEHLAPHPRQIKGDKSLGIGGLDWVYGDDLGNIKKLIDLNIANIENNGVNGGIEYDQSTGQFTDGSGNTLTREDISGLARAGLGRKAQAGGNTLARSALLKSLIQSESGQGRGNQRGPNEILASLREQLRKYGAATGTPLNRVFYSKAERVGRDTVSSEDAPLQSRAPKMPDEFKKTANKSISAYREQNRRIREQHITVWDKSGKWLKRQLSPSGLLPKSVFEEKIKRDSEFEAVEFDVKHLVGQFDRAFKQDYVAEVGDTNAQTQRILSDAMAGRIDGNLKEQTKIAIVGMRRYIDSLSMKYMKALAQQQQDLLEQAERSGDSRIMAEANERASLIETIMSNVGQYVHRSYRAFDDPKWAAKVPDEVLDAAREYLITRNAETLGREKAKQRAEVILNEILKHGTAYDSMESFIKESKLGAKDLSVLKTRKEIAPEIRALLGEYTDPRINFAKTATKMGRLIWNQAFLENIRKVGTGQFLFEEADKPAEATAKIAGDVSEVYSPLNGLWTTPEVNQAFKDALGKEQMADWYKKIVQINGVVKYGKTVLSPTTAARNWMSAYFFTLANGHFDLTHMKKSVDGIKEYFAHGGDAKKMAYLRELKQLGVVYDTPYAGEMMRLLSDSNLSEALLMSKARLKFKHGLDMATKFYQYGDDFWKIIGFENEKRMWMDTGMSERDAKVKAAERIRNTYPTYSMIGRGIQALRRFPLAGTFVSFPAEIIRTSYNMVRYIGEDYKDPKTRKMALRRAAGLALVGSFAYAAQALSMAALGYDDEDDEAVRQMAAPWQKNSSFIFTGRDLKGNLRYLDISFLDPYNYWKRPIVALTRGQSADKAIKESLTEILKPFFGTDITAESVFQVLANKKSTGGPVYKEHDEALNQFIDIADHLRKALQPGIASNLGRTWEAISGEVKKSGQKRELSDELAAWVGFRMSTLDPKVALHYRSFEFKDAKSDAERKLRDVIQDPNEIDSDDLRDAYDLMIKLRKEAFTEMNTLVNAARRSGMDNKQINDVLRSSGVSELDVLNIKNGKVTKWRPANGSIEREMKKARATFGQEGAKRIRDRYREVNSYGEGGSS